MAASRFAVGRRSDGSIGFMRRGEAVELIVVVTVDPDDAVGRPGPAVSATSAPEATAEASGAPEGTEWPEGRAEAHLAYEQTFRDAVKRPRPTPEASSSAEGSAAWEEAWDTACLAYEQAFRLWPGNAARRCSLADWRSINEAAASTNPNFHDEDGAPVEAAPLSVPADWPWENVAECSK